MTDSDGGSLVITGDCYSASFANAMVALDLDPVVLGDRWGYTWRPDSHEPLGDIRLEPLDFGSVVAEWYPLEIRERCCADARACLDWLATDPTRTAIVGVDSFWLPHSANHQLNHFPHAIAVHATGDGRVWVVDGYRGSSFVGALEPAALLAALDGMPLFTPRHRALQRAEVQLDTTAVLALDIVMDADAAARPTVTPAAMIDQLRSSCRRQLRATATQLGEEYANGSAALDAAAGALEAVLPAELRDDQIRYVMSCFASIASQRNLNAAFVSAAGSAARQPSIVAHAEPLRRAARQWITLRNTVYLRMSKGEDVRDRCAARMRELGAADTQIAAAILGDLDPRGDFQTAQDVGR